MAYYIWLDSDGNETNRETKGRGRTKKGAVEREDGNWVISESPLRSDPVPSNTDEIIDDDNDTQDNRTDKAHKTLTVREKRQLTLEEFKSYCHISKGDYKNLESTILMINVHVDHDPKLDYIRFGGVYSKIEIEKASGNVNVWCLATNRPPDRIIEKLIV